MPTLLIVDDSDIDRAVLRNILSSEGYNVIEASSGYAALEILNNQTLHIDALLLDINMPGLGGFDVLRLLDKSQAGGPRTFIISGEAQKDTILRAANFGVSGFFRKPYTSDQILSKLRSAFSPASVGTPGAAARGGGAPASLRSEAELEATSAYVEHLRRVYLTYLKSEKRTDDLYIHVSQVVRIMLKALYSQKPPKELTPERVEIISQAAYFYDIGKTVIRQEQLKLYPQSSIDEIPETHTIAGADLVGVNSSPSVAFFVKVCSDICMHHHKRYDGRGMPHGLKESINNIYTQMCSIAIEFCQGFFSSAETNATYMQFNKAMNTVLDDKDAFRPDVLRLLQSCQEDIVTQFS